MPNMEKVVAGLEHCNFGGSEPCYEKECPYYQSHDCTDELKNDILAMLKEQEAKLMTLDEVKDFGWDYCYLEEERLPGKEYRAVCGDYALTCITWPCITSMRIQHGDETYNKKWRCWTQRPTNEQRQVVKWDV